MKRLCILEEELRGLALCFYFFDINPAESRKVFTPLSYNSERDHVSLLESDEVAPSHASLLSATPMRARRGPRTVNT